MSGNLTHGEIAAHERDLALAIACAPTDDEASTVAKTMMLRDMMRTDREPGCPTLAAALETDIVRAYLYALDGAAEFGDLEGAEKGLTGLKVEKYGLGTAGWDVRNRLTKRSKKNPTGLLLDTRRYGIEFDVKFTCSKGLRWMFGQHSVGQWCILVRADFINWTFDVAVFFADRDLLNAINNDKKHSGIAAEYEHRIGWIVRNEPLADLEVVRDDVFRCHCLRMGADRAAAILAGVVA